ncbi:hypothetical protein FCX97_22705 [Escherichia coli]|nr:hypothetical protein [Escherichia coli]MDN0607566.1 hypothetical protein [Escherichia coli]
MITDVWKYRGKSTSFQMNAQRLIHTYTFLYTYIFVKPYVFLTCPLWFVTLVALALHLSFTL